MSTKKNLLIATLATLVVIFVSENPLVFGFCQNVAEWSGGMKYCADNSIFPEYIRQIGGFLSISLLFLSLLTYRMHDKVFRAWWNFARWFAPVIVVVTLLFNIPDGRGGGGMGGGGLPSGMLEFAVLGLLYSVFILGSLFKIIWEYLRIKD